MRTNVIAKRTSVFVLAAALLAATATPAAAQEIMYGSTAGGSAATSGSFGTVDQSTAQWTEIGDPTLAGPMPAMSMNSLGEVYGSNNSGGGGSSSHGVLIQIDPANGQLLTTIGDITDSGDQQMIRVTSFAFQPGTDVLYAMASKGAKAGFMYTIDVGTAVATLVGDTGLERGGLAFAPDGTLYLATAARPQGQNDEVIARIDPSNGSVIGTPVVMDLGAEGLAVRPSDGVIFMNYADGSTMYTVDPATGVQTLVGSYNSSNGHVSDITFQPAPSTATIVQSFLVPERMKLKINAKKPERSSLRINARLDECCSAIDYTQAVSLTINGTTWNLTLTPNGRGTVFKHTDDELRVVLRPRLRDTSRGVLSISLKRDMTGLVGPDENVAIRLTAGTLDVSATAKLAGTRYVRGRDGTFTGPMLYPVSARVKAADPDGSSMRATFGLNGDALDPEDVTVSVGTFQQVLPADEFSGTEERPRWSSRDPGVRSLRIDYRKGRVTLSISKATLGHTGGDLTLGLTIGGETVEMTVTPRTKGSSHSY